MPVSRILFISCQGIGNTVLCFPIFEHFRNQGAVCDCIVSGKGTAKLVQEFGLAHDILEWNESENIFKNLMRLHVLLRRRKYKAVYALSPAGRRENSLIRLAKAEKKYGWRGRHFFRQFGLLDPGAPVWDENKHDLESNRLLCGLSKNEIDEAIKSIRNRMAKGMIRQESKALRVALQPFTQEAEKSWNETEYRSFFRKLEEKGSFEFYFLGGEQDKARLNAITQDIRSKSSFFIGSPWNEILNALGEVDLFVGVDSCIAHIAGLLNIPTLVLYGFTDPARTGALGERTIIAGCSECGRENFFTKKAKEKRPFPLQEDDVLYVISMWINSVRKGTREDFDAACGAMPMSFGARFIKVGEI